MVSLSIHLTNIHGTGARQLVSSLLPAIRADRTCELNHCYLPDDNFGDHLERVLRPARIVRYRRRLPKAMSRFLECLFYRGHPSDDSPLLVLGDVPLRVKRRQILFLHNAGLVDGGPRQRGQLAFKLFVSKLLLKANLRYVSLVVVQTSHMAARFRRTYPDYRGAIAVLPLPVPNWISEALGRVAQGPADGSFQKLRLFYPAASYDHKNHALLAAFPPGSPLDGIVGRLSLTIDGSRNPAPWLPFIDCVGLLDTTRMIEEYLASDALLFLSQSESFGFPLIEAMSLGLAIICPDLAYARELCGDQAIFFQDNDPDSLLEAITELFNRRKGGWNCDWKERLAQLPAGWDDFASHLLREIERMDDLDASGHDPEAPGGSASAGSGLATIPVQGHWP